MTSILTSVKKMLGIAEADENFDVDLIMHINTVFMILHQLGLGPADAYSIDSKSNVWTEFIPTNLGLAGVKTYMFMKVKLIFDPPQSSFVLDSMKRQAEELEWRLNVKVDVATPVVEEVPIE